MEKWLLWTLISTGILSVVAVVVWLVLDNKSAPSYLCGDGTYNPDTEVCIHDKVCAKENVCGSGGLAVCIDPSSQKCVDDKACELGNVCGDVCIDPNSQVCMDDGTVCNKNAVCGDDCIDTTQYTCIDDKSCATDKACGDNCCGQYQQCGNGTTCVDCTTDLCEGGRTCCDSSSGEKCINDKCCVPCGDDQTCCPDDQSCVGLEDGTSICCDPAQVCLDSEGNQICCTGVCCGGVCCADGNTCVNDSCCPANNACDDGTCCDSACCGGQCCSDGEACQNGQCMTVCGDAFCDPVSQICDEVTDTKDKYCVNKGCVWQGIVYDPSDMRDNTGQGDIPVCGYDGKYYTCNNPTGVSADKLTRTVSDLQDSTSTTDCTINDCDYRFSEKGLIDVKWNSDSKSCTGEFDCDNELPTCGDCPVSGDDAPRCCMNSDGTYTGQLCPVNTICHSGECILGYYCGTNDGGFPQCRSTTDSSKVQYNSLSKCRDAGCMFQPASCYLDEVKEILRNKKIASTTNYQEEYIIVAIYGVNKSCTGHTDHVNTTNDAVNTTRPWIAAFEVTKEGVSTNYFLCAKDGYDSSKYYYIHVRSNGKSGDGYSTAGTPSLKTIIETDSSCSCGSTAPSGTNVVDNFDMLANKPNGTGERVGNDYYYYPGIMILVPTTDASSSCAGSSSLSGNYGLLPVTRWNPAGVF